jgi:hypothetical protein
MVHVHSTSVNERRPSGGLVRRSLLQVLVPQVLVVGDALRIVLLKGEIAFGEGVFLVDEVCDDLVVYFEPRMARSLLANRTDLFDNRNCEGERIPPQAESARRGGGGSAIAGILSVARADMARSISVAGSRS